MVLEGQIFSMREDERAKGNFSSSFWGLISCFLFGDPSLEGKALVGVVE